MLYPICPDCKVETKMTKEDHEYEFECDSCGKKLKDKRVPSDPTP